MSYLKSAPSNLSNCKISRKNKMLNFGPKMPYLGIFWARIFTKLLWDLKSVPFSLSNFKIFWTSKNVKIRDQKCHFGVFLTKNALFGYFWLRILKKLLWDLKSAPLTLPNCKISWNNKMPKFGTKSALFGYLPARILKNYCHIWNQHPGISVIASFCEETKIPRFGTKSALFGYFPARILKKLLSYLKSAPWN